MNCEVSSGELSGSLSVELDVGPACQRRSSVPAGTRHSRTVSSASVCVCQVAGGA